MQPIGLFTWALYTLEGVGDWLFPWIWEKLSNLRPGVGSQIVSLIVLWLTFWVISVIGEKGAKFFVAQLDKHSK